MDTHPDGASTSLSLWGRINGKGGRATNLTLMKAYELLDVLYYEWQCLSDYPFQFKPLEPLCDDGHMEDQILVIALLQ
jgi:hypothetical protein